MNPGDWGHVNREYKALGLIWCWHQKKRRINAKQAKAGDTLYMWSVDKMKQYMKGLTIVFGI